MILDTEYVFLQHRLIIRRPAENRPVEDVGPKQNVVFFVRQWIGLRCLASKSHGPESVKAGIGQYPG